jgi:MFS family permease
MEPGEPRTLRRDLRSMVGDGLAFSLMVGMGETYLPAFVLAAGLGDVAAGLVATLPMLAGACLQLATPWGVRRLGSHRRWVVWCARLQAASLLPLAGAALLGRVPAGLVFAAAALYWGFGMGTGPAWNTWVTTLVPARRRARFFARRNRLGQGALLAGILAGGSILDRLGPPHGPLGVFALLFGTATLARLVSAAFLARQSEPLPLSGNHRTLTPREFLGRLRSRADGALLLYLLAIQLTVHVAAPFFTPFLLGPLALPYGGYTLLIAAAFVARIVALPLLGRLAHGRGAHALLWIGGVGVAPLPALWLLTTDLPGFALIQVAGGVAWAALELGTLLAFFEGIDPRERTSVLTLFNLANALAIAAGTLLGAALFTSAGSVAASAYPVLFGLSAAGRLLCLPLLRRVPGLRGPAPSMELRTVAVRPNAGALQRPILASVAPGSQEGPEGSGDTGAGGV